MTRTLGFISAPFILAALGCTAISGFDDLQKSGCATAVCGEPDTSIGGDALVDSGSGGDSASDSSTDTFALDDSSTTDSTVTDTGVVDTSVDAPGDSGIDGDAADRPCPTGRGAPMVRVVATTLAGTTYTFCIDKAEATNAHYEAFLADDPPLSLQPGVCASVNSTFIPAGAWPVSPAAPNRPRGQRRLVRRGRVLRVGRQAPLRSSRRRRQPRQRTGEPALG